MHDNLIFFYAKGSKYLKYEDELIDKLNPPLNINKNYNEVSKKFRKELYDMRNTHN